MDDFAVLISRPEIYINQENAFRSVRLFQLPLTPLGAFPEALNQPSGGGRVLVIRTGNPITQKLLYAGRVW